MRAFRVGHATHPDWRMAFQLAAAQIDGEIARDPSPAAPTLGFVYFSDRHVDAAAALLAALRARWPGVAWVGSCGIGISAGGVEYFDEPALAIMLGALPPASFRVFSGARPLPHDAGFSALVHADPATPDLQELLAETSGRVGSGYLFGGLASSRGRSVHLADGVWQGGLSGVAFTADVALLSRVTQGCQPVGPARRVDAATDNQVRVLDGEPALACLLRDLGVSLQRPRAALPVLRATLVGLSDADEALLARGGQFGADTRVRHLIGLDPAQQAIAVGDRVEPGMRLAFCRRDAQAARRDLVRICSEIREELEPESIELPAAADGALQPAADGLMPAPASAALRIAGAIYVSCSGRGGPHFGGPSAELQIVRHALGDVPLVGFFAAGEIARHHLYGYTGVLTVFVAG